ncbi:orotidine-5'-phosphate decarboxylase [Chitinispirillales bacterium ANBcel5]|uniref:orotidine-5'-phosphate decarboxylase n=1 Tax=Cellulosispirillum alkaliphilum TaxID=3039283 RepID=UPI002A4FE28E|nr:orotidine-5'-phosphate decarboxylase [Chitinispirillales bacterium ANBcel5]
MKTPAQYLALALDNISGFEELRALIAETSKHVGVYKLGLEQFTRFGPGVLDLVREADRKIFLDLKFHDIPNTVAKAVASACDLKIDYLTIHTQGGIEMMRAAMDVAKQADHRPKILGVTLLTSINQNALNNDLGVASTTEKYVLHLASNAVNSGLDGLVCSANDLETIKPVLKEGFEVVTPGIRPTGAAKDDQKRVATPAWAIKNGSTLLVVGRPITGAENRADAAAKINLEIGEALK